MEYKEEIDTKIMVFISSKIGGKYEKVRRQLKSLIEDTGIAKTYVFEDNRKASTLSAEQDYTYNVDDCDVCLFLIDNYDGVPDGVMKEYQRAKSQSKKLLFIFCNENEKESTEIQNEISGLRGPKFYIAENFEEIINIGYHSIVNDITQIYRSYCKSRLVDPEFNKASGEIEEIETSTSESFNKQIFKNIDKTRKIITNEIFDRSYREVENTSDFDAYCAHFFKVLIGQKSIEEFNTLFLFETLNDVQSNKFHKIIKERWKAIQNYYKDNLAKAINYEKSALKMARDLKLSNWIVQDILIDLRNLYKQKGYTENKLIINSSAQKEIENEKTPLFYPLLDRYEKNLYEKITTKFQKESIKSPYTVTFGNNINEYADYISNIYILSIFNGSLTQLLRTFDRIKDIAFYLSDRYSNWEFRLLLIKMSLMKGNSKEIEGLINLFNDIYGKMNNKDSEEVYEFLENIPITFQRNIGKLLAFQYLGYYFSDKYYIKVKKEIFEIIDNWFNSKDKNVTIGNYIFDAFKENILRLDNNIVVNNIIKVFDLELQRFYDKVLRIIITIDFNLLNEENINSIIFYLEQLIKDEKVVEHCNNLKRAIIAVRNKAINLTKDLDKLVMTNMPEFYEDGYSLEINYQLQSKSIEHIYRFISMIEDRNITQGKNGTYSGYMDNPYKTIEKIIKIDKVKINQKLINDIISTCKDTLYAPNQTINAKVNAIKLITFFRIVSYEKSFDFKNCIHQLIEDEDKIFDVEERVNFNKTSKLIFYFNFSMMKLVFNEVEIENILNLLSSSTEFETFEKLETLKSIIMILDNNKRDFLNDRAFLVILQFALNFTNDENHDVRYYAVKALLIVISENNKKPILDRIKELMDYDSVYIKSLIMNYSEKLKSIDLKSFEFIIQKASIDNHYYVRKLAKDFELN